MLHVRDDAGVFGLHVELREWVDQHINVNLDCDPGRERSAPNDLANALGDGDLHCILHIRSSDRGVLPQHGELEGKVDRRRDARKGVRAVEAAVEYFRRGGA